MGLRPWLGVLVEERVGEGKINEGGEGASWRWVEGLLGRMSVGLVSFGEADGYGEGGK